MELPKFTVFTDGYRRRLYSAFINQLPKLSESDRKLIRKAYEVAYKAHQGVFRKGGNHAPYITHPIEVAIIIAAEMGFGATSIASALLHDVVEDNLEYPLEKIRKLFGNEIATIVEGVTKITEHGDEKKNLEIDDYSAQKEYFLNLLDKIPLDFRVLLIKVADRVHNMRTMDDMPEKSRKIKSAENMYIYAPLAGMAGLWLIKKELEDKSFKYLMPNEYDELLNLKKKYDNDLKKAILNFQQFVKEFIISDYDFEIRTIQKSLYSIWNKIKKKHTPYERIHNQYSTQIIINLDNKDKSKEIKVKRKIIYNFYVQISNIYDVRNIRDWVNHPKKNGYCALIFDVMEKGHWQEVQILTKKDSIIAEKGWIDKENAPGLKNLQKDILNDISEVINQIEERLTPRTITVYTPTGDRKEFPEGVTVLDFAFNVHTDLGLKCWGANINDEDKRVTRSFKLKNTDQVNIITAEYIKPSFEWLDYAFLAKTKKVIRNYLKKEFPQEYEDYIKKTENAGIAKFQKNKPFLIDNTIEFKTANCCKPIRGEKTFVYRHNDNSLTVHTSNCSVIMNILAKNEERTAIVEWGDFPDNHTFITEIEFDGKDRLGIAQDLIELISLRKIMMHKINIEQIADYFKGSVQFYVKDIDDFNEILSLIEKIPDISHVKRTSY